MTMFVGMTSMVGFTSAIHVTSSQASSPMYSFDASWKPQFPMGGNTYSGVSISAGLVYVTQRGNVSLPPVMVMNKTTGGYVRGFGQSDVGIAGNMSAGTWGSHGIVVEQCGYPCIPGGLGPIDEVFTRVWVEDFTNYTVTAFSTRGRKLFQVGTPGINGTGTNPLQFDHVADVAILPGIAFPVPPPPPPTPTPPPPLPTRSNTIVYATDGDGGVNNRVVAFEVVENGVEKSSPPYKFKWATKGMYDSPHSIALHQRSGLLVVADRGHSAIRLIDSKSGVDRGVWDCGLHFGEEGVPFGVRTFDGYAHDDLVYVASMDNPQDHKYQRISILNASALTLKSNSQSPCPLVQQITIDPAEYSGPHLLGIDPANGDIYAALVSDAPLSTVLRFKKN